MKKGTSSRSLEWLEQLVDHDILQKMLSSFSRSTGLKAVFVDTEGNTIISPEKEIVDCKFCQMIRSDQKGLAKCQRSYAQAGKEAAKYGEPYIFRCHGGLIAWAAPIILDEHIGSMICGQVLMWEPEDYFLEEIEEMVKGLDLDLVQIKLAASQLNVLSSGKVQAAADLLFIVANQIMKSGLILLEQRRKIAAQQAELADEMQARKQAEVAMRTIESRSQRIYYMEKEHKLKNGVRNCEYKDASLLLEKLLAEILTQTSGDMDALKMRVIELLVIVSRSALDGGADMNQVSKLNVRYYREVLDQFKIDEMCLLAQNMLKTFIDLVDVSKDKTGLQATQKAAEFIRKNFREKLTIDDIAQEVYLSPCYLSRIFKKSLGCTLMDYLAQVRVENARVMLKNPQYNVMQVAEENGFEDPGYFTRVFKKIEGITPSQYKQKAL